MRAYRTTNPADVAEIVTAEACLFAAPNPFSERTSIHYRLGDTGPARLDVYDAAGARVRTLRFEALPAGAGTIDWDGANDAGAAVASGTYFYRLETRGGSGSGKVLLTR